jgi:predicted O-methyltransferase YrrM
MDTELVADLYARHGSDLESVRRNMRHLLRKRTFPRIDILRRRVGITPPPRMLPQLDDTEAEITYLLLRHYCPETVVEVSPCDGWSTCWILHALRDNGAGHLHSYDLHDRATRNVPTGLSAHWELHKGDARAARFPDRIDYLFVDSDHSAEFAHWYIDTLISRLTPGTPVSVHDVFGGAEGGEAEVILGWLDQHDIPYLRADSAELKRLRKRAPAIHYGTANPMIYFQVH